MQRLIQQVNITASRYLTQVRTPTIPLHLKVSPDMRRYLLTHPKYKCCPDIIDLVVEANAYLRGALVVTSREFAVAVLLSRDSVKDSRFPAPTTIQPKDDLEFEQITVQKAQDSIGRKFREVL